MKKQQRQKIITNQNSSLAQKFLAAGDRFPGTDFDRQIMIARLHPFDGINERHLDEHMTFMVQVTEAIKNFDILFFHRFAKALGEYKKHRPKKLQLADKQRQAIILCRSLSKRKSIRIRDAVAQLEQFGVEITDETPNELRKRCREMGVPYQGESGRPKKGG